ncbi:MAG TPA: prepilin-type N-terminal cleavage/methylation domain-containing protein [Burkholderiaceae bacterium]|jgi:general secretion pathway protein J
MRDKIQRGGIRAVSGFTLIELLVAIGVLAIVAVLGWRGLDGIMRARTVLTSQLEETRGMQLTFAQMQSDCANVAPVSIIGARPQLMADSERLRLVRTVFADGQPSRLEVVVYRLDKGVLTRRESATTRDLKELDALWSSTGNDGGDGEAQAVTLQTGLASMSMRTWMGAGPWQTGAAPAAAATAIPGQVGNPNALKGLEISLQPQAGAVMLKVFLIGAA